MRDLGHVADMHRHTGPRRVHDDVLDLVHVDRAGQAAHGIHGPGLLNVAAAGDEVVRPHRFHHLIERDAVVQQLIQADAHLILLLVAAPAVDLGRAGNRAQGGLDDPILDRAQSASVSRRVLSP